MKSVRSVMRILSTWCFGLLCVLSFGYAAATTGAVNTTDDPNYTDAGGYLNQACLNGGTHSSPSINCNIYNDPRDVWLSGLVSKKSNLGDGMYFFAVLDPGGQQDPNDGAGGNLSTDTYLNRTFTVSGGVIYYTGSNATHNFDPGNDIIQLAPYGQTTNPGGVYILAVCEYTGATGTGEQPGVNPSTCKYDAFKIGSGTEACTDCPAGLPLTITKDAAGAYTDTFTWSISKSVDKTIVNIINDGSAAKATFNYTVGVKRDGGTVSQVGVTGTISVFNPNVDDSSNTVEVDADNVTDELSDSIVCSVDQTAGLALTAFKTSYPYSCTLTGLPDGELDNTAEVTWSDQPLTNGALLGGGSADFTFDSIVFTATNVDDCISVSDPNAPSNPLGTTCSSTSFTYSQTYNAPAVPNCQNFPNTATFATDDTGTTGGASQSVTVCHYRTALTFGYWKNHAANSAKTGSYTSTDCSKLKNSSCSSNGPWTIQYVGTIKLGNFSVGGILNYADPIWGGTNCSNSTSQGAVGCLAGQLLATKLNIANGSCPGNPAIATTVTSADNFLIGINYVGPSGTYNLSAAQRANAVSLQTTLNAYNNGGGC